MNQVYIINGKPRIGKDSFVKEVKKCLANVNYRVYNISAIEPILHLVEQIGFDVAKTVANRKMFSLIKQAVDLRDYTFNVTQNTVQNILTKKSSDGNNIIFIHCREPKEIDKYVRAYSAKTILIMSPEIEKLNIDYGNDSDNNVNNYNYTYIINNHKTLEFKSEEEITKINHELAKKFVDNVILKRSFR